MYTTRVRMRYEFTLAPTMPCIHLVYIYIYTRSVARYARNTSSPFVLEVHICPMHYYITCLSKSGQLELSHYLTLSPYLTLSHYLTLSPYITLSHYPGLSHLGLSPYLSVCAHSPATNTWTQSASGKNSLAFLPFLSRLPRARSQEHSHTLSLPWPLTT